MIEKTIHNRLFFEKKKNVKQKYILILILFSEIMQ